MNSLIIVSVCLVVVIPIVLTFLLRGRRKPPKCVYQKNLVLFSPEERILHAVVRQAVGEDFEILGKIRVGEIIHPKRETLEGSARTSYEELAARCFPFVLCNKSDLSVVCAVQMHDRSHGSRKSAEPDGLLKALCEAAGLPLVSIATSPFYDAGEIREAITDTLKQQPLSLPHLDGRKEPHISSIEGLNLE